MNERAKYRQVLQDRGIDTVGVDRVVDAIVSAEATSTLPELFARLKSEADHVPWHWDYDYAACSLQEQAPQAASSERQTAMLTWALERASRCASCATSGGEGLARSQHVHELTGLLKQAGVDAGR